MKLLKYLIAIFGILQYVETKAFQTSKDKDKEKGSYDHMYENLYLKKSSDRGDVQGYEMRYVPHVDGKPIFISLDEFEASTPPNMLKKKPTAFGYKQKPDPTKFPQKFPTLKNVYQEVEKKLVPVKEKHTLKKNLDNSNKFTKYPKEKPTKLDHPVVIDIVTKANHINYDVEDGHVVKPVKEPSDVKEMKSYEYAKIEGDRLNYDISSNQDSLNDSKHKVKENTLNYHAAENVESKKEEISVPKDSPVVVESVTKDYDDPIVIRPFKVKHKESAKDKSEEPNKNPVKGDPKTNIIKDDYSNNKISDEKEFQEQPLNHVDYDSPVVVGSLKKTTEDYDSPVVIDSLKKETTEDYDHPIVIRPFSEKHSVVTVDKKDKINKPVTKGEIKPALYVDTKIPEEKRKSDPKYNKSPINFLSEGPIDQDKDNPVQITKIKIGSKKDLSDESLAKKDYPISDVDHSINPFSTDTDYYEYENEGEYQDYDLPVIVEALVKKTDQKTEDAVTPEVKKSDMDNYEKPIVVEALVKKTPEIKVEDDKPIISAALVKKDPVKNSKQSMVSKDISENHNYEVPVIVEALVKKTQVKHNKKRIKYSTKPLRSSTHSYYEDNSKDKQSSKNIDLLSSAQEKPTIPNNIKTNENIVTTNSPSLEQSAVDIFSNEDLVDFDSLGDINDQFDTGSGLINERSGISDDLRSLSSKSNVWPILTSFHSQERNKFKKCQTTNLEPGNCMPIQMCPTPNLQLTLDDLLKKICAIDEVFIGICCPEFPAETLKVDWENFKNDSNDDQEELDAKPEGCGKIKEFGKDPQSWPWMAPLISVSTRRIFCGGVLIKEQYVLTAAHCTRKIPRNQIVVVLGPSAKDSTPQEFEVIEIKRHAQYNPRTMQNDLALLKLSRKVRRPFICLPEPGEAFVGKESLMLGWQGSFAASKTEEKLLVISPQECRKGAIKIVVGDNIMCTEPRTEDVMCNVDSGAPLVIKSNEKYEVIGILTWNRNDCDSSFPAIFTRVSHFKGWIENHAI